MLGKGEGLSHEEEDDERAYQILIKQFYEIYRPLQKKYNLRMHSYFDIYGEGLIEIWEGGSSRKRNHVCRIKENRKIWCYKRAIEELKNYESSRKEKQRNEQERYDQNCGVHYIFAQAGVRCAGLGT